MGNGVEPAPNALSAYASYEVLCPSLKILSGVHKEKTNECFVGCYESHCHTDHTVVPRVASFRADRLAALHS